MIKEAHKGRKSAKVHKWTFQGRTLTIEQYDISPKAITFFGGVHVPVDKETYSLRAVSRLQKQMRQRLYQYLVDNGLNSSNYILKIDAPERVGGDKVFLDLLIMFEPPLDSELKDLESMCETYFLCLETLNSKQ